MLNAATTQKTFRRSWPRSLIFLLWALAAFLIQVFPITGIMLMFLGAIIWPMALIIIALIGITWEAMTGRVSRWWLLMPVLAILPYELAALREHLAVSAQKAVINQRNAAARVAYNPDASDIVVGWDGDVYPEYLVANHHLTTVYSEWRSLPGENSGPFKAFLAANDAHCSANRDLDRSRRGGYADPPRCVIYLDEQPVRPQTRISEQRRDIRINGVSYSLKEITIRSPDGHAATITTGYAEVLTPMPNMLAGCGLSSSSWKCFVKFARQREALSDMPWRNQAGALAAQALDLRRITPKTQQTVRQTDIAIRVSAHRKRHAKLAYARLKLLLAQKVVTRDNVNEVNFRAIARDPARLQAMMPAILARVRQAETSANTNNPAGPCPDQQQANQTNCSAMRDLQGAQAILEGLKNLPEDDANMPEIRRLKKSVDEAIRYIWV
jgi:hypothetical protein